MCVSYISIIIRDILFPALVHFRSYGFLSSSFFFFIFGQHYSSFAFITNPTNPNFKVSRKVYNMFALRAKALKIRHYENFRRFRQYSTCIIRASTDSVLLVSWVCNKIEAILLILERKIWKTIWGEKNSYLLKCTSALFSSSAW
jgi:hypothetical protein